MAKGKDNSHKKSPKKEYNLRSSKKEKEELKKNSSSSDDDYSSEEEEFDMLEYRKMLSKVFPSKHSKNIAKQGKKLKKKLLKKSTPAKKEVEEVSEDEEDYDEDDYDEDEDEYEEQEGSVKGFNIILNIDDLKRKIRSINENYDEEDDEDYDDETNSESETCSESEYESKTESDESESDEDYHDGTESEKEKKDDKKVKYTDEEMVDQIIEMAEKVKKTCKKNTILEDLLKSQKEVKRELDKKNKKKNKKAVDKNCSKFRKLAKDKNMGNDLLYFKKLSIEEQKKYLEEMNTVSECFDVVKPYRFALFDTPLPTTLKAIALKKINALRMMEPGSGEYYKIKQWVDTFMRIPFEKYSNLPIHIDDGIDKCHNFMAYAKETLDKEVYGLNDAKMQIMQMIGQWITNPKAVGTAIAIQGPMGTGKTTLVKQGISKIMNRFFAFIALGGATDSSFLEGHSYTYEGSTWGKIVDIIIQSRTMNPIIYFDELDKISDTPRGQEIVGILTHLTDTAQNTQFHDKYFAEVDFNLSKCLFIFSYNDEEKVNPILKDRMYRIKTKGYSVKDKTIICQPIFASYN